MPKYFSWLIQTVDELHPPGIKLILTSSFCIVGGPDVSMSCAELYTVRKVIEHFRPGGCFIVGNAFGFSATYIAAVMSDNGGQRVVTIDSVVGDGALRQHAIATRLVAKANFPIPLVHTVGLSPQDLRSCCFNDVYDLVVIDASHGKDDVYADYAGIRAFSRFDTLFVFHDTAILGVAPAIDQICATFHIPKERLFSPTATPNVGFFSESSEVMEACRKVLDDPLENAGIRNFLAQLRR